MSDQVKGNDEVRDVMDSESTLLVPVSATATLRYGFFVRLIEKRGEPYRHFRGRFGSAFPGTADREALYESMTPVRASGLPLIVWVIRGDRSGAVTEIQERTSKLVQSLTEWRISQVAVAKHLFLNQRMTTDDLDTMLLILDEAGMEVDIYE